MLNLAKPVLVGKRMVRTSSAGNCPARGQGSEQRQRTARRSPMDRPKCEDAIAAAGRPFTGAEYLESLRDGREVYVYGERVKDVTAHPAFRNTARSIARLYDALHDA